MNPIAKRSATALAVAAAVTCSILFLPAGAIVLAIGAIGLLAILEFGALLRKKAAAGANRAACAAVLAVGALAIFSAFAALASIFRGGGPLALLYVVAVVKISDMGGFAFGVAFGRHKLCPRVSPNKSWEGLAGSVFASCLVSCAFMAATGFGWQKSLVLGAAAALSGTAGDLVESAFKRWVGVKDSSAFRATNGMGGILDMTDSLLFAPSLVAALAAAL